VLNWIKLEKNKYINLLKINSGSARTNKKRKFIIYCRSWYI
jgi:hypothetical protein